MHYTDYTEKRQKLCIVLCLLWLLEKNIRRKERASGLLASEIKVRTRGISVTWEPVRNSSLGPHPDLLNQNLSFNKISQGDLLERVSEALV